MTVTSSPVSTEHSSGATYNAVLDLCLEQSAVNTIFLKGAQGESWVEVAALSQSAPHAPVATSQGLRFPINYKRAAFRELAELTASGLPYKFWNTIAKQAKDFDEGNAFLELVDVLHFALSQTVLQGFITLRKSSKQSRHAKLEDVFDSLTFTSLLTTVVTRFNEGFAGSSHSIQSIGAGSHSAEYAEHLAWVYRNDTLEDLMHSLSSAGTSLSFPWAEFGATCAAFNVRWPAMYALYQGKAVLNKFRQENGDGVTGGNYPRIWNGVEDNVIMRAYVARCVQQSLSFSIEELRHVLTEALAQARTQAAA